MQEIISYHNLPFSYNLPGMDAYAYGDKLRQQFWSSVTSHLYTKIRCDVMRVLSQLLGPNNLKQVLVSRLFFTHLFSCVARNKTMAWAKGHRVCFYYTGFLLLIPAYLRALLADISIRRRHLAAWIVRRRVRIMPVSICIGCGWGPL